MKVSRLSWQEFSVRQAGGGHRAHAQPFLYFFHKRQYCRLVEDTGRMRSLFFTFFIKDNIAGWWRTQGACAAFSLLFP
jgi:hypothetical protein